MDGQWRDIAGWHGLYQVSDQGQVRRLPRGNVLSGKINRYGYRVYSLSRPGSKPCDRFAHLLVLEAFAGARPAGMYGCHNDGNPLNCAIGNLRWDTMKSNQADRVKHGTHQFGEKNALAKLSEAAVCEIRSTGASCKALAEKFGVTSSLISHVRAGRAWRHML